MAGKASKKKEYKVEWIDVEKIRVSKFAPRQRTNRTHLEKVTKDIQGRGVQNPIIVKQTGPNEYGLLGGGHRLDGMKNSGFKQVPVYVVKCDDLEAAVLAFKDNDLRLSLNPIEEGRHYQMMIKEFGLNQTQVAKKLGKDKGEVSRRIALLRLPQAIQNALCSTDTGDGKYRFAENHCRSLLNKSKALQLKVFGKAKKNEWDADRIQEEVNKLSPKKEKAAKGKKERKSPAKEENKASVKTEPETEGAIVQEAEEAPISGKVKDDVNKGEEEAIVKTEGPNGVIHDLGDNFRVKLVSEDVAIIEMTVNPSEFKIKDIAKDFSSKLEDIFRCLMGEEKLVEKARRGKRKS